ncbi:MAG TPA: aminoglycoside phosphotransferase family protein [Tepidiformaceae bacterium]|nr:aminoglycoside phosphotransferase family protein [Tepidiformaceae bacterium]
METTGRLVTLVVVTPDGEVAGQLPRLAVDTPWWQDGAAVVVAARAAFGVDLTILRVLSADRSRPPGGAVTYLAEAPGAPEDLPLERSLVHLAEHPLRMSWARASGPAGDVAWAIEELTVRGLLPAGSPEQVRTWNLSSLWRIPVEGQTAWLKVVPPFFGHEGAVIEALGGGPVPVLIAHAGPRMLMHEIPGEDLYGAPLDRLLEMIPLLTTIQSAWSGREPELLALGLPDWRAEPLSRGIGSTVDRTAAELDSGDRSTLAGFVSTLPARFAAIAACGLPDTLVHGDFHPGNVRGDRDSMTLLDWGDCGLGHPLLDQPAFIGRSPEAPVAAISQRWEELWKDLVPGCDPARASALIAPVAAARQAVIYRRFLDQIEPSEHPYHRDDPREWLQRTAAFVRAEG